MVKERMDLLELLRKGGMDGDVDFLREALRVLVEGVMDAEVSARTGAEYGERSPERVTQRNGYRSRAWDTRVGTMELHIPKLREGSYFPSLLEPRRRSERALLAVIQQAYVEGVSTRRVDDLRNQDMFVSGSIIMILGILTVIGIFISDLLLVVVDPRITADRANIDSAGAYVSNAPGVGFRQVGFPRHPPHRAASPTLSSPPSPALASATLLRTCFKGRQNLAAYAPTQRICSHSTHPGLRPMALSPTHSDS